ncbi:MAG: tetratricopeptide repeat protein [Candidatus Omnitrophica bacterium]|jgi:tetratricopeptide (TPR) repeat protein|nr:tetratricopeptide repeat protein [Candidatus Omnitrophota bacterium]
MKKLIISTLLSFCFLSLVYASESDNFLKKGNQYFREKSYEKALGQYQEALKMSPNDAEAYFNIGLIYREKGNYKEAKEKFLKAEELYTLRNQQEKKKEAEKLRRSMELVLRNQRRAGYLLFIFIPLFIFSVFQMNKKRIKFSQANNVIAFLLIITSLLANRFLPFFQRQSLLWWNRAIICFGTGVGGLFFLVKGLLTYYKLRKK